MSDRIRLFNTIAIYGVKKFQTNLRCFIWPIALLNTNVSQLLFSSYLTVKHVGLLYKATYLALECFHQLRYLATVTVI